MNAFKNTFNCDPEILADLLKVGMVDNFVTEFKRAASQMDSQTHLPELITQINNYLDAENVSKKRMRSRLEYAETTDMSPNRVDVVTPCKFVGAGWPSRRTILIDH
jgi:hypothetical protein